MLNKTRDKSCFGLVFVEIYKIVSEHEPQCSAETQFYGSPRILIRTNFYHVIYLAINKSSINDVMKVVSDQYSWRSIKLCRSMSHNGRPRHNFMELYEYRSEMTFDT
jgi:hypothetical protein